MVDEFYEIVMESDKEMTLGSTTNSQPFMFAGRVYIPLSDNRCFIDKICPHDTGMEGHRAFCLDTRELVNIPYNIVVQPVALKVIVKRG